MRGEGCLSETQVFGYGDGSVRSTADLEPFYRDVGFGTKHWTAE